MLVAGLADSQQQTLCYQVHESIQYCCTLSTPWSGTSALVQGECAGLVRRQHLHARQLLQGRQPAGSNKGGEGTPDQLVSNNPLYTASHITATSLQQHMFADCVYRHLFTIAFSAAISLAPTASTVVVTTGMPAGSMRQCSGQRLCGCQGNGCQARDSTVGSRRSH